MQDAASLAVAILKKKVRGQTFLGCDNYPLSRFSSSLVFYIFCIVLLACCIAYIFGLSSFWIQSGFLSHWFTGMR